MDRIMPHIRTYGNSGPKINFSLDDNPSITLVDQIAKSIVDDPDQVSVTAINGTRTTVLELRVAKGDLGKMIGKQGRTAQAIRVLVAAVASKSNQHIVLEIVE